MNYVCSKTFHANKVARLTQKNNPSADLLDLQTWSQQGKEMSIQWHVGITLGLEIGEEKTASLPYGILFQVQLLGLDQVYFPLN